MPETNAQQMARLADEKLVWCRAERPDLIEHYTAVRDFWRGLAKRQTTS